MVDTVHKLDKFLKAARKIRYYRDIRLNPQFSKKEKPSTISFIREEEVEAILKEDDLYNATSIKSLLEIRDLIVWQNCLSNEALEEIDFSLLINGSFNDLTLLRIYKEIELFSLEDEVRDVIEERFDNLINEYVREELSKEELEEIKRDNAIYSNDSLQDACDEEVEDTVTEFVIKRKVQDEILSNYVILLGLHLETLKSDDDEYKSICQFIQNLFFINKDLERSNEFLYNRYVKAFPFDADFFVSSHGYLTSALLVSGMRTEVLLDCYDYGVDLLFRNQDAFTADLIGIYLDTIQSLLSKNDIDALFTIVDDNYVLSNGSSGQYSKSDEIKTNLENRIYMNEERSIRGKTYIKGTNNG